MKVICQIYRSRREEGMYLFVRKDEGLLQVPETLLQKFGPPEPAMVLVLTPEKKLARADTARVLEALVEKGYYLQLPPRTEAEADMTSMHQHNSKM